MGLFDKLFGKKQQQESFDVPEDFEKVKPSTKDTLELKDISAADSELFLFVAPKSV